MKNIKRLLLALPVIAALVPVGPAQAQGDSWLALTYNVSVPIGNTADYIGQVSFRGAAFDYRQERTRYWTLGFTAAWHVFNEEVFGTASGTRTGEVGPGQGIDITGNQFRYINAFPLLVTSHYYFGKEIHTRFYAGGGVGTYYIKARTELSQFAFTEDNWHFGLAPEVGVTTPLGEGMGIFNVRWNYAFKSGDVDAQSYFTFAVGLAWF